MRVTLPLVGFRVLTLAHLYPGPFATMMLADLGADVIIVENPDGGDRTRRFNGHFEALNRNKRSIALDLKDPLAREAFLKVVSTADAVIEGFRPGVMDRLGLAPATLRERRPDLVCLSISGFGQDGPMSSQGAHDLSLQAAAGMIDIAPGGEADTPLPAFVLSDIAAANAAALGVVCALLHRERSGHAAHVDVSMLDSVVAWMAPALVPAMNGMTAARLPPTDPGYGIFASAEGTQISLSLSGEDHLWKELCEILELPELSTLNETARISDGARIQPLLRQAIGSRPMSKLAEQFASRKIPFGPVNRLLDVPNDPQVAARGLIVDFADEYGGQTTRYVRQALVFDGARTGIRSRAPVLGEHTEEVLRSAGITDDVLGRIRRPTGGGAS